MGPLVLVDGNQLLHRILHTRADPGLVSVRDAEDPGKIGLPMLTFVGILRDFILSQNPEKVVVVWDGGGWSKRRLRILPSYKMNRIRAEYDLEHKAYMERFRDYRVLLDTFLDMLCIPTLRLEDREADDVIAFGALDQVSHTKVIIFSEDQDFRQLVAKGVEQYRPTTKEFLIKSQHYKDGIKHEHYLLWKCCNGDPSDNIPGIRGVGEKTLEKIFSTFSGSTFGDLYDHSLSVEGALAQKFRDGFGQAIVNFYLMDLTLEPLAADEQRVIRYTIESMAGSSVLHRGMVEKVLRKYKAARALNHFDSWIEPFGSVGKDRAESRR